jgi:hypothetical protein
MAPGSDPVHKVIISGTGRSGTTFLVQLLTELGLDTGISAGNWGKKYNEHCNAGLEHDILDPHAPYIVKNPALCETLPGALATGRFIIDHAYVPVRDLQEAAASRVDVGGSDGSVWGGVWGTKDPSAQGAVLAGLFYQLVHTLVANDIPHTFILFPRMIHDAEYTRRKLEFLVKDTPRDAFLAAFAKVAKPSLVHSFGAGAAKVERAEQPAPKARGLARLFRSG